MGWEDAFEEEIPAAVKDGRGRKNVDNGQEPAGEGLNWEEKTAKVQEGGDKNRLGLGNMVGFSERGANHRSDAGEEDAAREHQQQVLGQELPLNRDPRQGQENGPDNRAFDQGHQEAAQNFTNNNVRRIHRFDAVFVQDFLMPAIEPQAPGTGSVGFEHNGHRDQTRRNKRHIRDVVHITDVVFQTKAKSQKERQRNRQCVDEFVNPILRFLQQDFLHDGKNPASNVKQRHG